MVLASQIKSGQMLTVRYKGEERRILVELVKPDYIKVFDLVKNVYRTFSLAYVEIVD